ncbi:E3 ubiquitin-protein ligase HOS1 [Zea mays]|uniref:E3 ubiquitin-protein ligase HOS1 n=2 Tax=Zea mays TaxID=4577 RepID=A0A1D6GE30_MAIZE|nr:E3 ubiquitin-protein ligase HOS1 [Zea mays]
MICQIPYYWLHIFESFQRENAELGLPETSLAIIPGYTKPNQNYQSNLLPSAALYRAGGTQRLPRIIGRSRAKELIFNGHRCGAAEAVTMGLANYCVPAGEAYQKALDIAFEITQKEAYSHLPKISSKETHPKIAQVLLERQKYDMALRVLKCTGHGSFSATENFKKDGISFLSEAVTVVRVRIECRLLTETFMYHRSYCSKVKEQHSENMTHAEDTLKNSWVYHVEMMVTEFCAICIKRNLVDKMMDLPWDSEEEKHLHKSLFDSAHEMPMKPNGSLLVIYYLRSKWLPLHTLAASGDLYLLNSLLKHNVDINALDKDGLPAIHKAILSKKAAIINYLLRNSANPFIQDKDLLARNAMLAEELLRTGGGTTTDTSQKPSSGRERVQSEALRQELEGAKRQIGALKSEKSQIEAEANNQRNFSVKLESDLKSLSEAYNSIEQANYRLDAEVKALRQGGSVPYPDVEAIKAQAKEEAEKESEAELNDLLVCLGQEQTKVEKLSTRLTELGEDVDTLLQGIGDDTAIPDDDDEDEDDEE